MVLNFYCVFISYVLLGKLFKIFFIVICLLFIMNFNGRKVFRIYIKLRFLYIKNVKINKVVFGKVFKVNDMEKI